MSSSSLAELHDSDDTRVCKKTKIDHDKFRKTEIVCYENYDPIKESGSVNFSSFNPVYPILACGLTKGNILLIEGKSQSDFVNTWERKKRLQMEETSAMTDFGWNMDGTLLIASFFDGRIVIWNRTTETLVEVKNSEYEQVWAISWNQHSPGIFASRNNQTILIWGDAQTCPKVLTQRYKFHTNLLRDFVWINHDQFASFSDEGLILLCQIERDSPLKSFNLGDSVLSISWNDTLKLLGSLTRNGSFQVWSMEKSEPDFIVKNERMKRPNCIAWYPSTKKATTELTNTLIACGLEDGSVAIWNIEANGDPIRKMREQANSIWDVSFSPDGNFLASIDLQGDLIIWSTESWEIVFRSAVSYRASKRILMWGGDGHKISIANPSEQVYVIEAMSGK